MPQRVWLALMNILLGLVLFGAFSSLGVMHSPWFLIGWVSSAILTQALPVLLGPKGGRSHAR